MYFTRKLRNNYAHTPHLARSCYLRPNPRPPDKLFVSTHAIDCSPTSFLPPLASLTATHTCSTTYILKCGTTRLARRAASYSYSCSMAAKERGRKQILSHCFNGLLCCGSISKGSMFIWETSLLSRTILNVLPVMRNLTRSTQFAYLNCLYHVHAHTVDCKLVGIFSWVRHRQHEALIGVIGCLLGCRTSWHNWNDSSKWSVLMFQWQQCQRSFHRKDFKMKSNNTITVITHQSVK